MTYRRRCEPRWRLFIAHNAQCQRCIVCCTVSCLLRLPSCSYHQPSLSEKMRWHARAAASYVFNVGVVKAFSRCSHPCVLLDHRASRPTSSSSCALTMGGAIPPGLGRRVPNGLGSWRVESVVDSKEPQSMFVFLFDDGSGEKNSRGGGGARGWRTTCVTDRQQ